jgi:tetratricopeptide (TPR) repeat protein
VPALLRCDTLWLKSRAHAPGARTHTAILSERFMKTTDQTRRKAQELAYRAMESYDPKEVLRLCQEAVQIDPRCVDALVLMAGAFEDPEERVVHMARVVQIAEEDLGGEGFFRESKGYFWGMLETRPYMRARSYLAQTLGETGRFGEAIPHYEAMLDLNLGNNQGLRYPLIGLYLETGDVDGVRLPGNRRVPTGAQQSAVGAYCHPLLDARRCHRRRQAQTDRRRQPAAKACSGSGFGILE